MEVVEGEERVDHGIIFKKVGPELRVVEGGFTTTIPSQALAISNKFGLTFFLHSQGFCVARTHDLVQASQSLVDSENEYNAKDCALANIHLPSAQALALSQDELIIAACMENKILFYNVPSLVHKGKEESQNDAALLKSLQILDEKPGAKMFAWNPAQRGVILVLSNGGKLTMGLFHEQHLKAVADEVEAADWSPDGEYLCFITCDKNLHICKSDLSSRSSSELPSGMFSEAINAGLEAYVDILKWARVDSILISIYSDGEEGNSCIFVLVSSEGHIAKDHSKAKIFSFEGFFTSIDTSILPADTGPYTLSNYVQPWELLIVTNRRSVDDHLSLLGWLQEGAKAEVYKFELLDDRFTPRIELQVCGDDNCVVGLAVDKTTKSIEIPAPNGDSGEKLKPGPVLLCMTIEGNLSLFSVARTGRRGMDVGVLDTLIELPEANEVLLSHGLTCKSLSEKDSGTEGARNEIMCSGTMAEKTNNENFQKVPTAAFEVASGLKLEPLEKKKDVSKGGLQAGVGVLSNQKVVPVPIDLKTKPVFPVEKRVTSVPVLSETESDLSKGGLQAGVGVPLKQKEAPAPIDLKAKPVFPVEKRATSEPVLSETESEFLRELDEVKDMAMQIEGLMACIEGKGKEKRGVWKPSFTKLLVEDIECKTRNLYRQCQNFREQLMEQRQSIIDLRDESLQVDTWRVYVQSILEQAFDVHYEEFWNQQTLHPEVAAMRKRILQADQSLKQQIAELEEHLHNLELSQWQKKHHHNRPIVSSSRFEDKNFRFMQSLYDTVNTQMVIAQQLAGRLRMQMEVLKLPVIPKEEMESLINTSTLKLQDMVLQEQSASDFSSRTGSRLYPYVPSDFSPMRTTSKGSLQTPTKPMAAAGTRTGLQDSTRRRRDSVDKLWVDVGAAKTTVKRAAPAKRFNGHSFSPNRRGLEAEKTQSKYQTQHSSSGYHSASGARSVVTNIQAFSPVQLAERHKQTRTDFQLEGEASSKTGDHRRPGYSDGWKSQPVLQGTTQVAGAAPTTISSSWPSTAVATISQTVNFSAPSKDTSFSKINLARTVSPQNVLISNAEKSQPSASHVSLGNQLPQNHSGPQSQTVFLSQATRINPPSIESTAQNTIQLKARPVETSSDVEVGKMDPFKKALISSTSQEKGSTAGVSYSPVSSFNDPQQKAALNVLQSKVTMVKQQGAISKSDDHRVGKGVIQLNSSTPVRPESHQSASLAAGMTFQTSSVTFSAALQGQATIGQAHETPKPEAGIIDKANTAAILIDSSKVSSEECTRKSLPAFENLCDHESLSPSNVDMVRTMTPKDLTSGPVSTVQADDASVSGVTSSASSLTIESASQSLGSSSSGVASSSASMLFKSPNAMPAMGMVREISTSSEVLPPASVVFSETSSPFNVSSMSSVKPPSFFQKDVMPAEQLTSPSTATMSTSFLPLTVQGPTVSDEEDMEEEGNNMNDFGSTSFAGFGLGTSSSAGSQQSNPFGASSLWNQPSPPTSLSVPAGQLFKPASFSIPTPQLTSQPSSSTLFGNSFTSGAGGAFANTNSGFGSPAQPTAAFGQPTQPGSSGQQALGNALGTFGQTRQIGSPFSVSSSTSGFGFATSGGFASAATGGGFASAATSGGFAGVGAGGGFAGVTPGGGFAAVASGGGFASAATGGGFASFSGGSVGGSPTPNVNSSAFGAFNGGFSAFGGSTNSSLFTQMRK